LFGDGSNLLVLALIQQDKIIFRQSGDRLAAIVMNRHAHLHDSGGHMDSGLRRWRGQRGWWRRRRRLRKHQSRAG
jgi:hypothetical protein